MKKIVVGLAIVGAIVLSGCGGKDEKVATQVNNEIKVESTVNNDETSSETNSDLAALGDISVDKNLFSVEFTVPKDFLGDDVTQESLNEKVEDGIKSVTLNADGSATYVMTKAAHKEMMDEMTKSLEEGFEDMISSGDYPTYKKIEHNSDFTEMSIYVDQGELGLMDSISVLGFYLYGGTYNAFNGTAVDNINVKFINSSSGEVIADLNSSEMGDDN